MIRHYQAELASTIESDKYIIYIMMQEDDFYISINKNKFINVGVGQEIIDSLNVSRDFLNNIYYGKISEIDFNNFCDRIIKEYLLFK